jgi:isopenicillin-N epimerase
VPVLVDGAHAPGMLPLDVPAIGADWYTGNLHKWAMAPRSCGFLWAPPERQAVLHPPVISWGYGLGFAAEFDWTGTRDATAMLAAPEGLAFMRQLGLDAMRAWNHALAWESACRLAERWGQTLPMREAQVGSMVTLPLPARFGETPEAIQRLKDALLYDDGIEVQMHAWKGRGWMRLSGQVYVEAADVDRLAHAMEART